MRLQLYSMVLRTRVIATSRNLHQSRIGWVGRHFSVISCINLLRIRFCLPRGSPRGSSGGVSPAVIGRVYHNQNLAWVEGHRKAGGLLCLGPQVLTTNRMPALRLWNRPIQSAKGSRKRFSFFLVHRSRSLKSLQAFSGGVTVKRWPQRLGAVNLFFFFTIDRNSRQLGLRRGRLFISVDH